MLQLELITKAPPKKPSSAWGVVSSMTCPSSSPGCWSGMPCASHVSVLFQKCVLPQRRIRSVAEFRQRFPEVKDVMIDGVERPIQRPQSSKRQNRHYSGKKKSHRRKKVVMTDARRRVLVLKPSMPGRRHENLVDRSQGCIPREVGVIVDTGFQGVKVTPQPIHPS